MTSPFTVNPGDIPKAKPVPGTRSVVKPVRYWIEVSGFLVMHGEFQKILEECGLVFTEQSLTVPAHGFARGDRLEIDSRHFFLVEDAEAEPELEGKLVTLTLQMDLVNVEEQDAYFEATAAGVEIDFVPVYRYSITGRNLT